MYSNFARFSILLYICLIKSISSISKPGTFCSAQILVILEVVGISIPEKSKSRTAPAPNIAVILFPILSIQKRHILTSLTLLVASADSAWRASLN